MLNMFGRDYEEVGSSNRGLILKNSGKIKIQWGKTFIDLLDNKGNLNSKLRGFVKSVSSEEEVGKNEAGYVSQSKKFVFNIDDEVVSINSDQDAYVSFLEVQNKSENEKLQALQNIGFVYNSIEDTNKYPMNGIIYIVDEQSLYIVDNGTLSKYQVEFPNPYPKQFVIAKEFQNEEGALVIQGEGTSNSLKFNNLKIYSNNYQSILDSEDEVVFRIRNSSVITINQDKTIIENGLTSDQNTFYSTIFDKKEDSALPQYSSELETELREHYLDPDYDNVIPTLGVIRDMIGTGGGGDTNVIEVVKVNNTALVPDANKAVNIEVPTKTSDLTNDSNFLTSFTETDPTVPAWAKASTKPSYTASEVGALPSDTPLFSGDYEDLTNKPTIPSAVTESTVSGWGFTKNTGTITGITMNGASKGTSGVVNLGTVITEHQDISGKANSADVYTKAQVDDMIEDVAYFGDTVGNVTTADFNAQSDTVWNKTQVLSSAQQAQARTNISAQEALVSGTNIKTINNESILGSGNITISGGGGGEANVIESISINGTAQTVTSKNVDLAVPVSSTITAIVTLTEAQYTALATKDSSTLYIITA